MDWFGTENAETGTGEVHHVSEVSGIIKELLNDGRLQEIWVEGEISNYHNHASGHRYFSLSENNAGKTYVINCTMWKSYARELNFEPKNGMKVLMWGSVEVYEPHGKYQMIARDLRMAGEGEKHLLVQRWKTELSEEGLFDVCRKKALPRFPSRVGVVTAEGGAARRDIEQVIGRRFPVEILLSPAKVQGDRAHIEIADAISRIDGRVDVMIVGRGGGSFEDLFAFNHPDVVRAIAACSTPVVSAVGHEVDVTLSDHAADIRAPTPSAAAELVVPDRQELTAELIILRQHMENALGKKIERSQQEIEELRFRLQPRRFQRRVDEEMQRIADLGERMRRGISSRIERESLIVSRIKSQLKAADPKAPMMKGYCLLMKSGHAVTSAADLNPNDRISFRMADGNGTALIEEVHYDKKL